MADKDLRPLLAIARAKLTLGLLILMGAIAVFVRGLTAGVKPQRPEVWCGVAGGSRSQVAVSGPVTPELLAYRSGEKLFKMNCASCHRSDTTMTAPALKGARERWEKSGGDLHAWVKNSLAYLKNHPDDAYAQQLFQQFKGSIMTPNALMDEEIDAILNYADNFCPRRASPVR